jgi:malonyl CoA-acyl carrier protein transacylase
MQPADEPFQAALSMTRVTDPRIPVYSNIEGVIYQNANTIRANLPKQVSKNILFELKMTKVVGFCNTFLLLNLCSDKYVGKLLIHLFSQKLNAQFLSAVCILP